MRVIMGRFGLYIDIVESLTGVCHVPVMFKEGAVIITGVCSYISSWALCLRAPLFIYYAIRLYIPCYLCIHAFTQLFPSA